VWDDGANTCGNPCPVLDQTTGAIWLTLTWNHGQDDEREIMANAGRTRGGYLSHTARTTADLVPAVRDHDRRKTPDWRWYATGPGVGIQLEKGPWKGRLLIPCDHSVALSGHDQLGYNSHVIFSDDHGRAGIWAASSVRPSTNARSWNCPTAF